MLFDWWNFNPLLGMASFSWQLQEFKESVELTCNIGFVGGLGKWEFTLGKSRKFSTMSKFITGTSIGGNHNSNTLNHTWNKILPIRIKMFPCRVSKVRLSTRINLDKRHVDLHDKVRFVWCRSRNRTTPFCWMLNYKSLCNDISWWWNIHLIPSIDLLQTLNLSKLMNNQMGLSRYFNVIVRTTLWVAWKFRNDKVFKLDKPRKDLLLDVIKFFSFQWISSRCHNVNPKLDNVNPKLDWPDL